MSQVQIVEREKVIEAASELCRKISENIANDDYDSIPDVKVFSDTFSQFIKDSLAIISKLDTLEIGIQSLGGAQKEMTWILVLQEWLRELLKSLLKLRPNGPGPIDDSIIDEFQSWLKQHFSALENQVSVQEIPMLDERPVFTNVIVLNNKPFFNPGPGEVRPTS